MLTVTYSDNLYIDDDIFELKNERRLINYRQYYHNLIQRKIKFSLRDQVTYVLLVENHGSTVQEIFENLLLFFDYEKDFITERDRRLFENNVRQTISRNEEFVRRRLVFMVDGMVIREKNVWSFAPTENYENHYKRYKDFY